MLYRDWKQGQSQGVPWSALEKQKDDIGQAESAISKNSVKQPVLIRTLLNREFKFETVEDLGNLF